jgi:hypothetical protein
MGGEEEKQEMLDSNSPEYIPGSVPRCTEVNVNHKLVFSHFLLPALPRTTISSMSLWVFSPTEIGD